MYVSVKACFRESGKSSASRLPESVFLMAASLLELAVAITYPAVCLSAVMCTVGAAEPTQRTD